MRRLPALLLTIVVTSLSAACGPTGGPADPGATADVPDAALADGDGDGDGDGDAAAMPDGDTDVPADTALADPGDLPPAPDAGLDTAATDAPGDAPADASSDTTDSGPAPLYRNDGTLLRDRAGRALLLHGINFPSEDVAAWAGKPADQDATDLAFIAASGFNAIRLVINWDRIEPQPDQYDAAYVALVARHAKLASDLGLYVIVDLHQDMYGMGFGLHGAPYWSCDEANYATFQPIDPWFFNYFSKEVSACFDAFWNDKTLQSHHHRAARELAKSLAGIDGVLGFDPHNEPFPGTIAFDAFERDYLGPFYDAFGAAVDEVLPGRIVFFEPAVLFSVNQATTFAAPAAPAARFFYPHYYNPTVELNKEWDGNVATDRQWRDAAASEAARLKCPWGLGEMGGDVGTTNLDAFLLSLYGLLDDSRAASFLWLFTRGSGGFGLVDEATNAWHPVARAFLRPAPSAVAGTPTAIRWDATARTLDLAWDEDPAAGDTVVLVPAWVDQAGYTATLDGADVGTLAPQGPGRAVVPGGKGGPRTLRLTIAADYPL